MVSLNPELNVGFDLLVFGGATLAVAVVTAAVIWQYMKQYTSPYVDFEMLRYRLESRRNRKATVNVQGTVVQEETKCVRSGNSEVEGVAKRVGFLLGGDLNMNISVSFLLRDSESPGNTIRVLEVHRAEGLDSVMQLVSNERGYRETILTFGTRVWIRGHARIEGNTILINPIKIRREVL
jgi:hypothetical protein